MPGAIRELAPVEKRSRAAEEPANSKAHSRDYLGSTTSYRCLISSKALRFVSSRVAVVHADLICSGSTSSKEGTRPGVSDVIDTRCQPNPDSSGPCQPSLDLSLNSDSENELPKILATCSGEQSTK